MPQVNPIQTSFAAGELSPRLHGKTQSEVYSQGMETINNFVLTPQGTLMKRAGLERIADLPQTAVQLFTFSRERGNDVCVAIDSEMVRLYDRTGQLFLSPAAGNLFQDPLFNQGDVKWNLFARGYEWTGSDFDFIGIPDSPPEIIEGLGVRLEFTSNETDIPTVTRQVMSQRVRTADGDNNHRVTFSHAALLTSGTPSNALVRVRVSTLEGGNDIGDFYQPLTPTEPIPTNGIFTETFIPNIDEFWVEIAVLGDYTGAAPAGSSYILNVLDLELIDITADQELAEFDSPYSVSQLDDIHIAMDSATGQLYFFHPNVPIQLLTHDRFDLLVSWDFDQADVTNFPDEWELFNWPSTGAIHDGRLWAAGTPEQRSTIWASKVWDYSDFEIPVTPTDVDPLLFVLASAGTIEWLKDLKRLLVGTDLAEIAGRSQGPVITTSDFNFPSESFWGSAGIQPVNIGYETLFVSYDLDKIRSLYDGGDSIDGYDSQEISINAEHLFNNNVIDISYTGEPNYQVNCLLANGDLVSCCYSKSAGLNGWYRQEFNGPVKSITSLRGFNGSELWCAVQGPFGFSLNILNAPEFNGVNLDGWDRTSQIDEDDEGKFIDGLERFAYQEVEIVLFDGANYQLHPPVTVSGDGILRLEEWAVGKPFVGQRYTATAKTLKLEGSNRAGTAQSSKRRYNKVFARLNNSAIPTLNENRAYPRKSTDLMNASPTLITGDVEINASGYDDGQITLVQDLPLRTEVTALFGNVASNQI